MRTPTEIAYRTLLDVHGAAISAELNEMIVAAFAHYAEEGIDDATVAVHAFNAWEMAQHEPDELGTVAVGELHDGDATAVLRLSLYSLPGYPSFTVDYR
jgi:hypothetical protein